MLSGRSEDDIEKMPKMPKIGKQGWKTLAFWVKTDAIGIEQPLRLMKVPPETGQSEAAPPF